MRSTNVRLTIAALACAITLLIGTTGSALAANNNQTGLVNVNLQDIALAIPVSVAVPVGVAANACGISVLAAGTLGQCTATNNSMALSQAVGTAIAGGSGSSNNNQTGLVNVNVQGLYLALPVSVALPVGLAANVCGVSVLSAATAGACDAQNTSSASSIAQALARALP